MATTLTYFSLLGISEDAGREELEARYHVLAEHLTSPSIPPALREWAKRQAALVDEAYAVLADPERRAAARRAQELPSEPNPSEVATVAPNGDPRRAGRQPDALETRKGERRQPARKRVRAEPAEIRLFDRLLNLRSRPLVLGLLLGLVVLGGILFTLYGLPGQGGSEETPSAAQAQDSLIPLDNERVAQLMAAVQQDPNNKDALFELGELYFEAGEWQTSIDWLTRLMAVDPSNLFAMTDIGTANFNLGRPDLAKQTWLRVLEVDPNYVQAHYNLGFLYANVEPQDLESAKREWDTVVRLAPGSNLANTAQVHLSGLPQATPADASAGSTPSPP